MHSTPRTQDYGNHETIGSDIMAVLKTVVMPEQVLGRPWHDKLQSLKPEEWYPISVIIDLLDHLLDRCGQATLVKMGKQVFRDSHQEKFLKTATCGGDAVMLFDGFYRKSNRGSNIGGWKVLEFRPGYALLEKTTPHLCLLEEGIWAGAFTALNIPVLVVQPKCRLRGDKACRFEMRSSVRDQRWMGTYDEVQPKIRK